MRTTEGSPNDHDDESRFSRPFRVEPSEQACDEGTQGRTDVWPAGERACGEKVRAEACEGDGDDPSASMNHEACEGNSYVPAPPMSSMMIVSLR